MIQYYPWSDEVLKECLTAHDKGELATLDLELTAKCSKASCIYCDSKPDVGVRHPNELNSRETVRCLQEARKLGLRWIYSCGLGEPLEDGRFRVLVQTAGRLDVRVSLFTNGILIDKDWAKWLHDNGVCVILKMDTFSEPAFDTILGRKGAAQKVYKALDALVSAGYGQHCEAGMTDIAFSIVPTRLNLDGIEDVVKAAKAKNIFPSIGELERAGRALQDTTYRELGLDSAQLKSLRKIVEKNLWKGYVRPICPAIISGLHIDNVGNCLVDFDTGLNCKWFLLGEPMVQIIGNVRSSSVEKLFKAARKYRQSCFKRGTNGIARSAATKYVFGGCGGNPCAVIRLAKAHL